VLRRLKEDPGVNCTYRPRGGRRLLVPSLIALALVSSACTESGTGAGRGSDQSEPIPVGELTSIDTLRDAFNEDAGSTRLILLISPT
jgi:hypothetical protein